MKIRIVRTGGVGGMRREAAVDTDRVDADCAARLRSLLDLARRAGVFEASSSAAAKTPDRFRYHLTVEDEHGCREARFTEEAASQSALQLVETVWNASESDPPGTA
jgi:hypothetical protein